jgi:patatin-related protein
MVVTGASGVVAASVSVEAAAADAPLVAPVRATRDDDRPTLRLALAMRGGVSLAVWIGGAVAELDQLRYAGHADPAAAAQDPVQWRRLVYRKLLELADFADVEVDVLAGASAGGLNAVLYGTAQSVGAGVDDMLDLWRAAGQLSQLMHKTGKRPGDVVRAPLRGDAHFYGTVFGKLADFVTAAPQANTLPPASHVSIGLSATLLPERVAGEPPLEPETDTGHASFAFVGRPGRALNDLPAPPASNGPSSTPLSERDAYMVARLALAARSTSSFPGAFERATIPSADGSPIPAYRRSDGGQLPPMPNMADVFCALRAGTAEEAEPFHVTDGGVLDNIGIARALGAIASAPAARPTARRLLYLDPDPSKQPLSLDANPVKTKLRRGPDSLATLLRRVFSVRLGTKTVRDDLAVLRAYNEESRARQATRDVFTRQLFAEAQALGAGNLFDNLTRPSVALRAYAEYRAATDLPRITNLLVSPQRTIAIGQVTRGMAYATWPPGQYGGGMLQFRGPLSAAYSNPNLAGALGEDLTAVADTVDFLIAWARSLQGWVRAPMPEHQAMADKVDRQQLMEIKRRLYRILFVATVLRDRSERSWLRLAQEQYTAVSINDYFLGASTDTLQMQRTFQLPPEVLQHLTSSLPGSTNEDARFYDAFGEYLMRLGQTVPPSAGVSRPTATLPPFGTPWWDVVNGIYRELLALGGAIPEAPANETALTRTWRESLPNTLLCHQNLVRNGEIRQLAIIFAGAGGLPDSTTTVAFESFDADVASPLAVRADNAAKPPLAGSWTATRATWAGRILHGTLPDIGLSWLTSDTKLAGNQVANFSGFLSQRWRINDWTWGRADASANTVRLLVKETVASCPSPDPNPTGSTPLAMPPAALKAANELALLAGGPPRPTWSTDDLNLLRDAVIMRLQSSIIDSAPAAIDAPDSAVAEEIAGHPMVVPEISTGLETPAVLSPAYRGRTVMSLGLLIFRTVWPSHWSILTFFGRAGLALIRPLWTYALLFGIPARAALISFLLLGAWAVADADTSVHHQEDYAIVYASVLGAIAIGTALVRLGYANRRAGRAKSAAEAVAAAPNVESQAHALVNEAVKLAKTVSRRLRGWAWTMTVISVLGTLELIYLASTSAPAREYFEFTWPEYIAAVLLIVGAVGFLASRGRAKLKAATGRHRRRRTPILWALAALTLVAIATAHRWVPEDPSRWLIGAVGVGYLVLINVVASYDWMRLRDLVLITLAEAALMAACALWLPVMASGLGTVMATAAAVFAVAFSYPVTTLADARNK